MKEGFLPSIVMSICCILQFLSAVSFSWISYTFFYEEWDNCFQESKLNFSLILCRQWKLGRVLFLFLFQPEGFDLWVNLVFYFEICCAKLVAKIQSLNHNSIRNWSKMSGESAPKPRVVLCPKCRQLLQEPPDYDLYKCGGCGTVLQG